MIERAKFIPYLQKLEKAYAPKLNFTRDMVDLWYEMFQDCEEEGLRLAVDNCIKSSEFAPNIATLMKFYRELADERETMRRHIEHEYGLMKAIWGEKDNAETFDAIVKYIYKFPKTERKEKMVALSQEANSYYHDLIIEGVQDIPTIKEYVERL